MDHIDDSEKPDVNHTHTHTHTHGITVVSQSEHHCHVYRSAKRVTHHARVRVVLLYIDYDKVVLICIIIEQHHPLPALLPSFFDH